MRPLSVTADVRAKVLESIRSGNYREVAARYAGICPATLRNYLRRKDEEAVAFLAAIHEAEAAVENDLVGAIKRLAAGDLKAATWYLSHKFPARWADNSKELREIQKTLQQLANAKSKRKAT